MIGLVVATHAGLAPALIQAAETIVGPLPCARSFSVDKSSDLEQLQQQLQQAIDEVGVDGAGVILLTDMFGGTPANLCARCLAAAEVEVVNGVNLPMILKFASSRHNLSLKEMEALLQSYGRKSIVSTRDVLSGVSS